MKALDKRIAELEQRIPIVEDEPEITTPLDFDALMERLKVKQQLKEHPDPFVRLKHHREEVQQIEEEIQQAEHRLATPTKVNAGRRVVDTILIRIAQGRVSQEHYAVRAAELEILELTGFDTGELRAQHRQCAVTPKKWLYLDNQLPDEAKAILDRHRDRACIA